MHRVGTTVAALLLTTTLALPVAASEGGLQSTVLRAAADRAAVSTPSAATNAAAVAAAIASPGAESVAASTVSVAAGAVTQLLVQEASAYAAYQNDVGRIEAIPFTSAEHVNQAFQIIGAHHHEPLSRGMIAYSSLIARESQPFADALRGAADVYGRDAVLQGLRFDMRYASQFNGAASAQSLLASRVSSDAARLRQTGAVLRGRSQAIADDRWAKGRDDADRRAARLGSDAASNRNGSATVQLASASGSTAAFWSGFRLGAPSAATTGALSTPSYRPPTVDRALTLAALEILGEGDAAYARSISADSEATFCLDMAQKELQNCVETRTQLWEQPACLAQHAMNTVATCLERIGGARS